MIALHAVCLPALFTAPEGLSAKILEGLKKPPASNSRPASSALTTAHLSDLRSKGFTAVPNYASAAEVDLIKQDVSCLQGQGQFKVAGVGEANTNRVADGVRRCQQSFIFPRVKYGNSGDQAAKQHVYSLLDRLRDDCSAAVGEKLDPLLTEGLYASYPNGGYYRRHVDALPNTPQELRKVSFLLYCNEDWQPSDGGCLRIHRDGGGEMAPPGVPPAYEDIEPRAGTLVLFRCDVPHEVLDTSAERLALVGWFNAPPQGSSERRSLITALAGALAVGSVVKFGFGALMGGTD